MRVQDIIRDLRARPLLSVLAATLLLLAGLLAYSQSWAAAWDEGFHVVAAQLILHGKRPYLDFLFPQTPLNAYWAAAWMRIFGESWRMVHTLAAILTGAAVFITGEFVLRRFLVPAWRLPVALAAAIITGLNTLVFEFGTIGQAYAFCLFLIVSAFRLAVLVPDRGSLLWPALAGFAAGAAANGSLLTAPVGAVLILWIAVYNRIGNRWMKAAAFLTGGVIPTLPLAWFFLQSPRRVLFNVFDYHFFYRQVEWEGAPQHNFEVLISWINSSQALLLGLLTLAGLLFVARRGEWDRSLRAELYLCAWLPLALILHISTARPTFVQYYLFTAPFLAILASVGLYAIGSRVFAPDRPWMAVAALAVLYSLGLGKSLYDRRSNMDWRSFEQVAGKVEAVTPRGQPLLADELIYFLTRREPPSGMELEDSHKLNNLAPEFAAWLHIVPRSELDKQIKEGTFRTVETCDDDDERVESFHLPQLYAKRAGVSGCAVYWNWIAKTPDSPIKNESRESRP